MQKKKTNRRWIWILVGIVVLLAAAAAIKNQTKPKGEKITVEQAGKRDIREIVSASGKIFPIQEVKISSDVSGEVRELYVKEGDSVRQGQLLARIDPDTYESAVERGQAAVNSNKAQLSNARSSLNVSIAQREQIEAQLANARTTHKRNEELYKEGVISKAEFDNSLSSLRSLEANLRSANAGIESAKDIIRSAEFGVKGSEASLKELRTSLQRTSIYAPSTGVVSKLNVEKGERVVGTIQMTGTEIMRIANLNAFEVKVDVSENDVLRLSLNDEATVEVDAYVGRKFKGRVTEVANSASNVSTGLTASLNTDQVTNFMVTIQLDPASYEDLIRQGNKVPFRPGMSASVDITTDVQENVLAIPIQAVTTREGETTGEASARATDLMEMVFVMKGDTVDLVPVTTGIQDDEYIQILSGLQEGDQVVSGPYSAISKKLEQGSKVYLAKPGEKEKARDKKNEEEETD